MNKKIIGLLILLFTSGISTLSVAASVSQFADVPAKHWAYAAVKKLVQSNIITADGDSHLFERTMTRYEMAQLVANAMTKLDQADTEQKDIINKLASEFSSEINILDIQAEILERKANSVKFTGEAKIRYNSYSFQDNTPSGSLNGASYRLRLNGSAKVDDNTTFDFRFVTRQPDKNNFANLTYQDFGSNGQSGSNSNNFDRAAINTKFGAISVLIGRQAFFVDAQTVLVDYNAFSFDGVKISGKSGLFDICGTYGRFLKDATYFGDNGGIAPLKNAAGSLDVTSLVAGSKAGKFNYALGYYNLKNFSNNSTPFKWTVFNSNYKFNEKYNFNAEYLYNGGASIYTGKGNSAYSLQLAVGDMALKKKNEQVLYITYLSKKANSLPTILSGAGTPLTNAEDFNNLDFQYYYAFSKFFNIGAQYSLVRSDDSIAKANYKLYRIMTNVRF